MSIKSKEVRAGSWAECLEMLNKFRSDNEKAIGGVYFRGQSDATWSLETTLERTTSDLTDVGKYFRMVRVIEPEIAAHTGATWSMPAHDNVEAACARFDGFRDMFVNAYSYLVHLRHHGFPSPLLDWTGSPYVAAYFALRDAVTSEDVAIYAYCEHPNNMKETSSELPLIITLGPIVRGHARHFRQQSRYTICCSHADRRWRFVPHQQVFDNNQLRLHSLFDQDLVKKFVFPASERAKILSEFDQYNLNDFSLFGSEEALMTTLAIRKIGRR